MVNYNKNIRFNKNFIYKMIYKKLYLIYQNLLIDND